MAEYELREVRLSDFAALHAFLKELAPASWSRSGWVPQMAPETLQWLLVETPFRREGEPLGFGLFGSDGSVLGTHLHVPWAFALPEGGVVPAVISSCSYVVPELRESGEFGILFERFRAFGKTHVIAVTTANEASARFWKAIRGVPIEGTSGEKLVVLDYGALVAEKVGSKVPGLGALVAKSSRLTSRSSKNGEAQVRRLESAQEILVGSTGEGASTPTTFEVLNWRYFAKPEPVPDVWEIGAGGRRAVLAVLERRRGSRQTLSVLQVLEIFVWDDGLELDAVVSALHSKYPEVAAISFMGSLPNSATSRKVMDREFAEPIGWRYDRKKLLAGAKLHWSPAVGDGFI
ncbi:MAG: hypothetical protein ACK4P3_04655 [Fimbriimonadaceae bacterium]